MPNVEPKDPSPCLSLGPEGDFLYLGPARMPAQAYAENEHEFVWSSMHDQQRAEEMSPARHLYPPMEPYEFLWTSAPTKIPDWLVAPTAPDSGL